MNDVYTPWSPEPFPRGELFCQGIHDDDQNGLRVMLEHETGRKLEIAFPSYAAYRNVNESFRLRTWRLNPRPLGCGLLMVQNSAWLMWLRQEAGGVLDDRPLKHYAIFTGEDCLDIATEFDPIVREVP